MAWSKKIRLSFVDLCLRKPDCVSGKILNWVKNHWSLPAISFSITLERQDVREIGLYADKVEADLPGLRIGITIACFQMDGTNLEKRKIFNM